MSLNIYYNYSANPSDFLSGAAAASSLTGAVPSSQSSGRTQSAEIARTILLSDLCVPMLAAAAAPVLMHPPGPTVVLTPGAVPPVPILARPPRLTLLDSMAVRVKCSSHLSPHLDHPLPSDYSAHSSVYLVLPRCHHTSRPTCSVEEGWWIFT